MIVFVVQFYNSKKLMKIEINISKPFIMIYLMQFYNNDY